MLTEQGNDVYCAKQVTFSERGVGLPCSRGGGGWIVRPKGGQVKSSVLL